MEHWDLRTLDVQPHQPQILHSSRGESRSIAIHLPAGEMLPRGWMDLAGPRFVDALAREANGCRAVELDIGGSVKIPTVGDAGD